MQISITEANGHLAKRLRRAGAGAEAVMQVFDETRAMCISPGTSG